MDGWSTWSNKFMQKQNTIGTICCLDKKQLVCPSELQEMYIHDNFLFFT
jgi:hypothetical protein